MHFAASNTWIDLTPGTYSSSYSVKNSLELGELTLAADGLFIVPVRFNAAGGNQKDLFHCRLGSESCETGGTERAAAMLAYATSHQVRKPLAQGASRIVHRDGG